jgi:hypothetical protein
MFDGGSGDDSFLSSEIVLLIGALVVFVVLLQAGVVAPVGEWVGEIMLEQRPIP